MSFGFLLLHRASGADSLGDIFRLVVLPPCRDSMSVDGSDSCGVCRGDVLGHY